jgi:threonine dehydratase
MADGLKTVLGKYTFPVIQKHVKEILRVEEQEIAEAMKWIWERMKLVVEPSSAVTLAAIFRYPEYFQGKKVGIIISGGNVDLGKLPF